MSALRASLSDRKQLWIKCYTHVCITSEQSGRDEWSPHKFSINSPLLRPPSLPSHRRCRFNMQFVFVWKTTPRTGGGVLYIHLNQISSRRSLVRHCRKTHCKQCPYIHGYSVASFPYFNGTRLRICLYPYKRRKIAMWAMTSLFRRFMDTNVYGTGSIKKYPLRLLHILQLVVILCRRIFTQLFAIYILIYYTNFGFPMYLNICEL